MPKLTLNDLANLQNENTAVTNINANSTLIEAAVENTLSRDGTAPNQMEADLDMNSNNILNVNEINLTDGTTLTQLPTSATEGSIIYRGDTKWEVLGPGVSNQVLRTQGPGASPTWTTASGIGDVVAANQLTDVNVTQSGTGAVPRTANSKILETVSVKDFGAVGDGVTDDTVSIVAAIAAASASTYKRTVLFPAGIYLITTLGNIPANVMLVGENRKTSVLRTSSAIANVMSLNGQRVEVRNLTIDASVARTDGYYIDITTNASVITIREVDLLAPFVGIRIPDPVALVNITDVDIENTVATTGRGIDVEGGFAVHIDHLVCRVTGSKPFAHINVTNVEDLTIVNSQLISGISNLNIAPGTDQNIGLIYVVSSQFDNATNESIRIAPTTGGNVREVYIQSPWIFGATYGVRATTIGGGGIDSIHVANSLLIPPGVGAGTGIEADGANNVIITGCRIGGFNNGVRLNNMFSGCIGHNKIGPHGLYGANAVGLIVTGATHKTAVVGNLLTDNTLAVDLTGLTGANNVFTSNVGYPTEAPSGIVVGASPFTYTAGPSPETVYINEGTVSLIEVDSVGVLQSTGHAVSLRPNQALRVTYSVTPSMVKSINN